MPLLFFGLYKDAFAWWIYD